MHVVDSDIDGTLVSSAGFDGGFYEEAIGDLPGLQAQKGSTFVFPVV